MSKVAPRLIQLLVAAVDRSDEVSKATISSDDSDTAFVSFLSSRSGGSRDYTLNMTVAQDHASGTLWDLIWTGAGTQVAGKYAPYGNTNPTVAQPHYTFTAVVSEPNGDFLGAAADPSPSQVATVDVAWRLTGKPVKVTV